MNHPTCETCPYFRLDPGIKGARPASGVQTSKLIDVDVRAGYCYGEPPAMLLVPVAVSAREMNMLPQPFERTVLAERVACRLHPAAPVNDEIAEQLNRSKAYFDSVEKARDAVEAEFLRRFPGGQA